MRRITEVRAGLKEMVGSRILNDSVPGAMSVLIDMQT